MCDLQIQSAEGNEERRRPGPPDGVRGGRPFRPEGPPPGGMPPPPPGQGRGPPMTPPGQAGGPMDKPGQNSEDSSSTTES